MNNYDYIVENLKIIGIPSVNPPDIDRYDSLLDLLKDKADSFDDLGSNIRISMSGSIVNVGKAVISLLSDQFRRIKRGG